MDDQIKLGAAVLGGYLLGRTKKGGLALRLANALSGHQAVPRAMDMARQGVSTVTQSDEAQKLFEQIRGPMLEAVRAAMLNTATGGVTRLTEKAQSIGKPKIKKDKAEHEPPRALEDDDEEEPEDEDDYEDDDEDEEDDDEGSPPRRPQKRN